MAIKKTRYRPPVYVNGNATYPDIHHFETSGDQVKIDDAGEYFTAEDTEGVLQEVGIHIANIDNPHGVTSAQVGAVPTTRTVNSKALSSDITLSASDVGAVPTIRKVNNTPLGYDVLFSATTSSAGDASIKSVVPVGTGRITLDNGTVFALYFSYTNTAVHVSFNFMGTLKPVVAPQPLNFLGGSTYFFVFYTDNGGHFDLITTTKASVGLSNVNNTADKDKPISTAVAGAMGDLAYLNTTEKSNLVGAINELDTDKVETSAIVNTLTETEEGKILDARQGKVLADLVSTNLNATIKNEIKNGDFSGAFVNDPPSIEGWGLWGNSSASSHRWVIEDEKFKTHISSTSSNGRIHQDIPCLINDKYYLTVTFEGSGFTRVFICDYETDDNLTVLTSDTSSVGKWSYTFTSDRSGFRLSIAHMVSDYTYTNRTLDNIMLINLTQTFGAGNEPTKEEMDVLILLVPNGYWEGELTLSQKLILNWQLALIRANTLAIASL